MSGSASEPELASAGSPPRRADLGPRLSRSRAGAGQCGYERQRSRPSRTRDRNTRQHVPSDCNKGASSARDDTGAAFDVQAVCAGFIFALVADNALRLGQARTALVIGAETFSRILDWEDRGTSVLFGDGAGAVVLKAVSASALAAGLFSRAICIRTAGNMTSSASTAALVDAQHGLTADGRREVFRQAVQHLSEVVDEALRANDLSAADIDWLVPHQANSRIIDGMGRKLGLSPEKIVTTIERHANTSAASIPLALEVAVDDGRIKRGDLVLMEALGGGLSWGASLVRW